jgi:pimeloyl-ACP methyl ester carboxylesterase
MRFVVLLRCCRIIVASLILPAVPSALATDTAPYTASADFPLLISHGYTMEVAPAGYPPVRLYAEETGQGPTLLLLHGLGGSGYQFRRIMPELARRHRVITLDLRGFGRSDKPFDTHYSALDQAAHVREFIRRRGLAHITLAGHSFGGGVALALTLDLNRTRPGAISRLILMNAPAFPQPLSLAVSFLRKPVLPYLALNLIPSQITAQLSFSQDLGKFGHITETDVTRYAAPLAETGAVHALVATARHIVPANLPDLVRRYPTIRQPTLLVWCRSDPVVPLVTGISLKRMLPDARLRIIDGCTHVPPEETPGELLAHMQNFLGSGR